MLDERVESLPRPASGPETLVLQHSRNTADVARYLVRATRRMSRAISSSTSA